MALDCAADQVALAFAVALEGKVEEMEVAAQVEDDAVLETEQSQEVAQIAWAAEHTEVAAVAAVAWAERQRG